MRFTLLFCIVLLYIVLECNSSKTFFGDKMGSMIHQRLPHRSSSQSKTDTDRPNPKKLRHLGASKKLNNALLKKTKGPNVVPRPYCMNNIDKIDKEGPMYGSLQPSYWGFINHMNATLPDGTLVKGLKIEDYPREFAFSEKIGINYIHLHKCGGGSIRLGTTFKQLCKGKKRHECKSWIVQSPQLYDCNMYKNLMFKSPLTFSFVRNPWSRAVSMYHYAYSIKTSVQVSFNEFAFNPLLFGKISPHLNIIHIREQYVSIIDEYGRFMVEYLGRMETLDSDFITLLEHVDNEKLLEAIKEYGVGSLHTYRANGRKKPSWREMYMNINGDYDYFLINMVACHYNIDILLFGYQFEPLDEVTIQPILEMNITARQEYITSISRCDIN